MTPAFEAWEKAIKGVNDRLMPLIDLAGGIFDYNNTLSELKRLSSESSKDVDGNYLVDPKRVEILEKNLALIEKIRKPFQALNMVLKSDASSKYIGGIAQIYGVSPRLLSFAKDAQVQFGKLTSTLKDGGTLIVGIAKTFAAVASGYSDTGIRELIYSFGITQ